MITVAECVELPTSFDTLFDQTLPLIEAGTLDWRALDNPSDKKETLKQKYLECAQAPSFKVIEWKKDDTSIHLAAGHISPVEPNYILWLWALYGSDATGSKAWLHDRNYIETTRDFIRNTLGVVGYKIEAIKDSSIYNYHMSKVGASDYYDISVEKTVSPDKTPDLTVSTIKYTYK